MRIILLAVLILVLLFAAMHCFFSNEETTTGRADGINSAQTHKKFAISLNGKTWKLLAKKNLTGPEKAEVLYAAYGSAYHWRRAGTIVNMQRGEWLIARVNSRLEYCGAAMRHSKNCQRITSRNRDKMKDFDIAYSLEALARAHAVCKRTKEAEKYFAAAKLAGERIKGKEDKKLFMRDLRSGNWHGAALE